MPIIILMLAAVLQSTPQTSSNHLELTGKWQETSTDLKRSQQQELNISHEENRIAIEKSFAGARRIVLMYYCDNKEHLVQTNDKGTQFLTRAKCLADAILTTTTIKNGPVSIITNERWTLKPDSHHLVVESKTEQGMATNSAHFRTEFLKID